MNTESTKPSTLLLILIPIFGIIFAIFLIEVAFRLIYRTPEMIRYPDRPRTYYMPEHADSMRDQNYSSKKEEKSYRIVVVGDSFTFGPYLQFDDTFSKKLERWLNLNKNQPKVEVLSFGFSGSSTKDEVKYVNEAVKYNPDLIILQITLNDAEPHLLSDKEKKELFDATYLESPLFDYWKSLKFILSRVHNTTSYNRYIQYHSGFFKDPDTFSIFDNSIKEIAKIATKHQIKLNAVIFPMFDFPCDDNKYPFLETHQIIESSLSAANIKSLDLRKSYIGIAPDRLQIMPGRDSHPNESAHRIAAEKIMTFLNEEKIIPKDIYPNDTFPRRKNIYERSRKKALKE